MSTSPVYPNADQFPDAYAAVNFSQGEIPTSNKLNIVTTGISDTMELFSIGIGNTFVHGIPNIGASIGNVANINSNYISNLSVSLVASSPEVNQIGCTITNNINGGTLIALDSPYTLSKSHHVVSSSGTYTVYNILIAHAAGGVGGPIDSVYYGLFQPCGPTGNVADYTGGDYVNYVWAPPEAGITSTNANIVLAANTSLVDAITQIAANIGQMNFGSQKGTITASTGDNTIATPLMPSTTITQEINNIENKPFAVRWNVPVSTSTCSSLGGSYMWNITAGDTSNIDPDGICMPIASTIAQYLALSVASVQSSSNSTTPIAYGVVNGAPLLRADKTLVPVTIAPISATLTSPAGFSITIAIADLAYITTSDIINVYFPVEISFTALQSLNMDYTTEGAQITDIYSNTIGYQYAYGGFNTHNLLTTKGTIADRLEQNEDQIALDAVVVDTMLSTIIPNGSFEIATPAAPINGGPDQWQPHYITSSGVTNYATWQRLDASGNLANNSIHGEFSLAIISSGAGNQSNMEWTTMKSIPISPQDTYYLKFKTQANRVDASGAIIANFFDATGNNQGSQYVWLANDNYPTTWSTLYGIIGDNNTGIVPPTGISMATIPSTARFMTISLLGGSVSNLTARTPGYCPDQTINFDGIEFFTPAKSGLSYLNTVAGTYTFVTPGNCVSIDATLIGGGGSGADGFYWPTTGGGSGALIKAPVSVTPDTSYQIIVGQGGGIVEHSAGTNGVSGGFSAINTIGGTSLIKIAGGGGGYPGGDYLSGGKTSPGAAGQVITYLSSCYGINAQNITAAYDGIPGGVGTSVDTPNNGGWGAGLVFSVPYLISYGGRGAQPGGFATAAGNGSGPGAGGGGGANGSYNWPAGNGADGMVLIEF